MFDNFAQAWGNIASIAGFFLSLVGFGWTVWLAWQARSAAKAAERAASEARRAIIRSQTIAEVAQILVIMEEIKRLHRVAAWPILLERYSTLRRMLVAVRSDNPEMSNEHKSAIQSAIQTFKNLEDEVEATPPPERERLNPARFNTLVSTRIDEIGDLLTRMKQDIGR